MPKISQLHRESLANDVVAHFEQEASLSNHYLDTASLYKMLVHVPSEVLQEYLDANVSNSVGQDDDDEPLQIYVPNIGGVDIGEFIDDYDRSICAASERLRQEFIRKHEMFQEFYNQLDNQPKENDDE